jgi:hypothetical protein
VIACRRRLAGRNCGSSLLSKRIRHWTLTARFL